MPVTLLYHDVLEPGRGDSGFPGAGAARYKLTSAEFADHLRALSSVAQIPPGLIRGNQVPAPGSWLLTFDDGGSSALEPTARLLEESGWRGNFFITAGALGTQGFLSAPQVIELHRRGHAIGSHSWSHPVQMSGCTREQLLHEWQRSREAMEALLGEPVLAASVPGGYYSRAVAETAAQAGYKVLMTSEPTTRIGSVAGCLVVGRYSVYRGMPGRAAARLLSGRLPRWRQAVLWNFKKVAKTLGGSAYRAARERILAKAYAEGR